MTEIDTALKAIAAHKSTMLVAALKEVMIQGATTKARRDQVKGALRFAAAHLGDEAA